MASNLEVPGPGFYEGAMMLTQVSTPGEKRKLKATFQAMSRGGRGQSSVVSSGMEKYLYQPKESIYRSINEESGEKQQNSSIYHEETLTSSQYLPHFEILRINPLVATAKATQRKQAPRKEEDKLSKMRTL
jgi:hypothetical protein